jgi:ABC-2 type transport system ATP-binding protein
MPSLKVENLYKYFNKHGKTIVALENINLLIEEPKVVCLVGLNGAGKTTLINCISGILIPDKGKVEINGKNPAKHLGELVAFPYSKPQIGYNPRMSVKEFLELLSILFEKPLEIVLNIAEKFELDQEYNTQVQKLSLGWQKRLEILSAIVQDKPIVVLDEITNGLDLEASEVALKLLKEYGKKHIIIFASHIYSHIDYVNDVCVFIHKGKVMKIEEKVNNSEEILKSLIGRTTN